MPTVREDFEAWYWEKFPFKFWVPKDIFFAMKHGTNIYENSYQSQSFEPYQAATNRATKKAQEMNAPRVAAAIGGE